MINKINPFYILAFFATLFIISSFELSNEKDNLKKEKEKYTQFENSIDELDRLKNTWETKTIQKKINTILSLSKEIEYKSYKSKIVLTLSTKNSELKQRFINKVLNNNLKIEKFDIKEDLIVFEIGNKI